MTAPCLSVQEEVRELLTLRERKGLETYGRPLTTWDGRCALTDAIEEAADELVYLVKVRREWREMMAAIEPVLAALPVVAVPGETTYPIPARDLLRLRALWDKATGVVAG